MSRRARTPVTQEAAEDARGQVEIARIELPNATYALTATSTSTSIDPPPLASLFEDAPLTPLPPPDNDIRFSRFRGIVPQEAIERTIVAVIGCGGIGSWLAMGLACLGVKLRLYDPDETAEENFGGQPLPYIGTNKARQLEDWCIPYDPGGRGPHLARELKVYPQAFDKKSSKETDADIWAFAVDSIEMRAELYKWACIRYGVDGKPGWVVDGRIGGAESNMMVVPMGDAQARGHYAKTLAPAGGFTDDPCTMRSTVFAGMGVAAQMVGAIASILRKDDMARGRQMNSEWLRLQHFEGWTR